MLEFLKMDHVGPAPHLEIKFKQRMNFLTGDNGLGKTFLLDVAWWAMSETWAREPLIPHGPPVQPEIKCGYSLRTKESVAYDSRDPANYPSQFNREVEQWWHNPVRRPFQGLVLYAQVDGGFSIWDPIRNNNSGGASQRPEAYHFKAREVWEGNKLCEGLVRDWASWQREDGDAFSTLKDVLTKLSPSEQERLQPGPLRKLTLDDPKRYPTLRMANGQDVAVIHASASMRRIISLAYLLVWAWREHLAAAELKGVDPCQNITFLIDEVEAHLHPQWQRRIVPALLQVMEALTGEHDMEVQLITATHSPLVLASVEPVFDEELDALFLLDIEGQEVSLTQQDWSKQGDVVNWLVSDTFGLQQGRSLDAERAIKAANAWMRGDFETLPENLKSAAAIDAELRRVLAGHDAFWPRWVVWVEQQEKL
ncbi:MAG: AAA family ATPase [Acidobacteriota bacterium]|nr:AAA family ATPase [Acidobacteriota bacterium]